MSRNNNNLPKCKLSLAEKEKDTSSLNDNEYFGLIVRKNDLIVILVQNRIGYMAAQRNNPK